MNNAMYALLVAHAWCLTHSACVEKLLELIILASFRW